MDLDEVAPFHEQSDQRLCARARPHDSHGQENALMLFALGENWNLTLAAAGGRVGALIAQELILLGRKTIAARDPCASAGSG